MFAESFASTIVFGLYFVFIFGLYFLAKVYEKRIFKTKQIPRKKSGNTLELMLGKDANPVLLIAQFFWVLFILMSIFHLISMVPFVIESVIDPCDPTRELGC